MVKRCVICNKEVEKEHGKLKGTIVKVKEDNKNQFIYVCSSCQKREKWFEEAKIKSV